MAVKVELPMMIRAIKMALDEEGLSERDIDRVINRILWGNPHPEELGISGGMVGSGSSSSISPQPGGAKGVGGTSAGSITTRGVVSAGSASPACVVGRDSSVCSGYRAWGCFERVGGLSGICTRHMAAPDGQAGGSYGYSDFTDEASGRT